MAESEHPQGENALRSAVARTAHAGDSLSEDLLIREASPEELREWDTRVSRYPDHCVYHRLAWIRSVEEFAPVKPLFLVFEKQGEIAGHFAGFLWTLGPLRIFGSPREGWQTRTMGPLIDRRVASDLEVMESAVRFLERELGVWHIELITPSLDNAVMRQLGFEGRALFTYRVPLFPDEPEHVLRNMDRKTRNQVKKAQKLGLAVRARDDFPFIDEFYGQLKDVFARRGKSIPFGRGRVASCFKHMQQTGNLLALSVHLPETQACIATGLFFVNGCELTLWGWTHRHEYRWYCPTEILTWTAMQKGMEAGCTTLDMSGGGEAKAKFGALPDQGNYRWMRSRYRAVHVLRECTKKAFRLKQRLTGRMEGRILKASSDEGRVEERGRNV